jgi:Outer membrane protein beta-barrel domain
MRALSSIRLPLLLLLALPASALAQSHLRLSYEMAVPLAGTTDFIDRFSSRGAHLDASLEISPAIHLEASVGWNLFNAAKTGVLHLSDGRDVSGKQFRYLNAFPAMGGLAFHIPLRGGSSIWVGFNGGGAYIERLVDVGMGEYSHAQWQWGVMPHLGISFGLDRSAGTALFITGRWEYYWQNGTAPKQSWVGIGVGFLFGHGRKSP